MRHRSCLPFLVCIALLTGSALSPWACAQTGPAADGKKPPPNKYGSPLDTLMSTHLWTDVPPAQPFVQATHPDPKKLDYTPLTGKDPDRPTPRDTAGIQSLQAELEKDASMASARAKGLAEPVTPVRAKKRRKPVRATTE